MLNEYGKESLKIASQEIEEIIYPMIKKVAKYTENKVELVGRLMTLNSYGKEIKPMIELAIIVNFMELRIKKKSSSKTYEEIITLEAKNAIETIKQKIADPIALRLYDIGIDKEMVDNPSKMLEGALLSFFKQRMNQLTAERIVNGSIDPSSCMAEEDTVIAAVETYTTDDVDYKYIKNNFDLEGFALRSKNDKNLLIDVKDCIDFYEYMAYNDRDN